MGLMGLSETADATKKLQFAVAHSPTTPHIYETGISNIFEKGLRSVRAISGASAKPPEKRKGAAARTNWEGAVHRIFQRFVDHVRESADDAALEGAMAEAVAALDLPRFAYLSMPRRRDGEARLIATYPSAWSTHFLHNHYERIDPVIQQTLRRLEPFEWGLDVGFAKLSPRQKQILDEGSTFGLRCGFTIPLHDGRGPISSLTFAVDERESAFRRRIESRVEVLQLMAILFHTRARRVVAGERIVDGVELSPREFECLEWAARGKSRWDISRILGISQRTAGFHLDSAKAKLGVRTTYQAVALFAASKPSGH